MRIDVFLKKECASGKRLMRKDSYTEKSGKPLF